MTGYIYNIDTMELIIAISGRSNQDIENQAEELGYMGTDEYGLTYTREGLK